MTQYKRGWRDGMVSSVALDTGISKRDVRAVADGLLGELFRALDMGERVVVEGFGSFETITANAKWGRHFKAREAMLIPRKLRVRFSASKMLLNRLNR